MNEISNAIYEACNGLAGHSWLFDNCLALALYNPLIKSALLGACFLAAWYATNDEAIVRRNRRILVLTLFALVVAVAVTKPLSTNVFVPRPFIQSQTVYHLEGDQLVQNDRLAYRVPLDDGNQRRYRDLLNGDILQNDLASFPSDHAGFYVTLAVGILLVSRPLGWLALGWTFVVILGSRVVTGHHSPFDIWVGTAIAVLVVVLFQVVLDRRLRPLTEPIVNWTLRHQKLAAAFLFIVMFEVVNTLEDLDPIFELGAAIAKRFHLG